MCMGTAVLLFVSVWAPYNLISRTEVVTLETSTKLVSVGNDWVGTSHFLGHLFLHFGHSDGFSRLYNSQLFQLRKA